MLRIGLLGVLVLGLVVFAPALFTNGCLNLGYVLLLKSSSPVTDNAAGIFSRCAESRAQAGRAARAQGEAALAKGNHEAALALYARARSAGQSNQIVEWRFATLYDLRGDTEAAILHWRAAGAAPYFLNRGLELRHLHNWTAAEKDLRLAARIGPTNPEFARTLGEFYWEWGKLELAVTQLETALEVETAPYEQALLRGEIAQLRSKPEDAARFFQTALKIDPGRPEAYRRLADVLADSGQPQAAVAMLNQGAGRAAPAFGLYLHLGRLLTRYGDFAGAERALEQAEFSDPGSDESWIARGQNAFAWGHYADSRYFLERALGIESENAETRLWLARVNGAAGACPETDTGFARAGSATPKIQPPPSTTTPAAVCP